MRKLSRSGAGSRVSGRGVVKITGDKAFRAKLKRISGPEMERSVGKALFRAGNLISDEAQDSITRGSASAGRHIASAPGEPPNNDTGVLKGNIEVNQVAPLKVEVSSNAPYAADLEFGTSKMAERPYMRPALAAKRAEVKALLNEAVDHVLAGGKL